MGYVFLLFSRLLLNLNRLFFFALDRDQAANLFDGSRHVDPMVVGRITLTLYNHDPIFGTLLAFQQHGQLGLQVTCADRVAVD